MLTPAPPARPARAYVGRFAKIGFANGGANARITDDCESARICEIGLGSGVEPGAEAE